MKRLFSILILLIPICSFSQVRTAKVIAVCKVDNNYIPININVGIAIDLNGLGEGTTAFTRQYNHLTRLQLVANPTESRCTFDHWEFIATANPFNCTLNTGSFTPENPTNPRITSNTCIVAHYVSKQLSVTPSSVDYGLVATGDYVYKSFSIYNDTNASLTVNLTSLSSYYTLQSSVTTIPPFASKGVQVKFTAPTTHIGTINGQILLESGVNNVNGTALVNLTALVKELPTLSGNVINERGQPISAMRVMVMNGQSVVSNTDGKWSYKLNSFGNNANPYIQTKIESENFVSGYVCNPLQRSYSLINDSISNIDFTCTYTEHTVSGTITNDSGESIEGATISFSNGGGSSVSTSEGTFTHKLKDGYSGSISIQKSGMSCSSQAFANVTADITLNVACSVALPISLVSFEVKTNSNMAHFTWQTAQEVNNDGFYIQSFIDNKWVNISPFIKGTSLSHSAYSFSKVLPIGKHLIRLMQYDFDGTQHTSETLTFTIEIERGYHISRVFPNPIIKNAEGSFSVTLASKQRINIILLDLLGRKVQNLASNQTLEANTTQQFLFSAQHLSSGTYVLLIQGENFIETQRVVIMK